MAPITLLYRGVMGDTDTSVMSQICKEGFMCGLCDKFLSCLNKAQTNESRLAFRYRCLLHCCYFSVSEVVHELMFVGMLGCTCAPLLAAAVAVRAVCRRLRHESGSPSVGAGPGIPPSPFFNTLQMEFRSMLLIIQTDD